MRKVSDTNGPQSMSLVTMVSNSVTPAARNLSSKSTLTAALASTNTSPLSVSMMSRATVRPTMNSGGASMDSTPAFFNATM